MPSESSLGYFITVCVTKLETLKKRKTPPKTNRKNLKIIEASLFLQCPSMCGCYCFRKFPFVEQLARWFLLFFRVEV